MSENIPVYTSLIFILCTLYGIWLFKRAFKPSKEVWMALIFWLTLQAYLAYTGFFQDNLTLPPKFAFALGPALILIGVIFFSKKGKLFMDGLDPEPLHWIHTVRIPVEVVLWLLFVAGEMPKMLTFEGKNLDILAGLTVPLIIFYGIRKNILDKNRMLLWNVICLFLVLNIVSMAILSVETPFQQLHLENPTQGIMYFPFIWLPSFIVPMVLFSHFVSIRKLLKK